MALTVREYLTADGKSPFRQWLNTVGEGVWEARVMFGPGYRIYFGKDGDTIIVLLVGGDKGSQAKDIARAQGFWRHYLETKPHGKTT